MWSTLYRKRHEKLPPLPDSVDDLNFDGEQSKTLIGEDFMLGSRDGVFMISTSSNLALIAEALPSTWMELSRSVHERRLVTIKEKYEVGDYILSELVKAYSCTVLYCNHS